MFERKNATPIPTVVARREDRVYGNLALLGLQYGFGDKLLKKFDWFLPKTGECMFCPERVIAHAIYQVHI